MNITLRPMVIEAVKARAKELQLTPSWLIDQVLGQQLLPEVRRSTLPEERQPPIPAPRTPVGGDT